MPGEKNLATLLKLMQPRLNSGEYVFCTVGERGLLQDADPVMFFRESEGITIILEKSTADRLQLEYTYVAAWITLTVHSSLEAVGLTAAFATTLAKENISCNVVAGYYHDHLFVDVKDAAKAMAVLQGLSA